MFRRNKQGGLLPRLRESYLTTAGRPWGTIIIIDFSCSSITNVWATTEDGKSPPSMTRAQIDGSPNQGWEHNHDMGVGGLYITVKL